MIMARLYAVGGLQIKGCDPKIGKSTIAVRELKEMRKQAEAYEKE